MTVLSRLLLVSGMAASCTGCPLAAAHEAVTSHCKAGESAFLDARMHRPGNDGTEKILSLCGNSAAEPLTRLVFRFGPDGKPELELLASPRIKAGIFRQSDSASHSGLLSIRFYGNARAYEVSEGLGMSAGIRLEIYRRGKRVATYESLAAESRLTEINFDLPSSPIFRRANPFQAW